MPFDLEAVWSAAIVLLITNAIDPSLLRGADHLTDQIYQTLGEMASRGNLVADARRSELQQLEFTLSKLAQRTSNQEPTQTTPYDDATMDHEVSRSQHSGDSMIDSDEFQRWTSDGISGEQLEALANSLDFQGVDWFNLDQAWE